MTFITFCLSLLLGVFVQGSFICKSADFGYNFTLPCADNVTKDIIWLKRQQVREQLHPNINIFDNGSLRVVEAQKNDFGEYLCRTVNITETVSLSVKKIGQNYTVQCPVNSGKDIYWFKQTRVTTDDPRVRIWKNGSLYVDKVTRNDHGQYLCKKANVVESNILESVYLSIKTPPPPPNVTIKPSTIIALVLWNPTGDGGYPIINFTAEYRLAVPDSDWIPISPNHITPNSRQLEVYSLKPNTTYEFRIWATNQLGKSPVVNVFGTTQASYKEEDLLKHLFREVEEFNASTFDINLGSWTGIWSAAVIVFMVTFVLLCFGTIILLCQEWITGEDEPLPNIILNPNFENDQQTWKSATAQDENLDGNDLSRLNTSWAMENATQK